MAAAMSRAAKRRSIREAYTDSNKWDRFYALMGGSEPQNQIAVKAKRKVAPRVETVDAPYEGTIQADIIKMLRKHPKVAIVERHNSGTAVEQGEGGAKRYIRYNTVFTVNKVRMRKSDIDCTLVNGKRFVCEVKRPPWDHPTDQREIEQQNYILHVKASTGYGLFATSVQQVEEALDRIVV